jgi:hypothetical protein
MAWGKLLAEALHEVPDGKGFRATDGEWGKPALSV